MPRTWRDSVAIASSLGIGHVQVPLVVPFNLGINGNAITVSPRLFAMLSNAYDVTFSDPKASARALARVIWGTQRAQLRAAHFLG